MIQANQATGEIQNKRAVPSSRVLSTCGCLLLICLPIGCAASGSHLDKALMADKGATARNEGVAENYLVACPDVLDISLASRPDIAGQHRIEPDGCLDLGKLGRVRVEEQPLAVVARKVAGIAGVAPQDVAVRAAEYNSQQVYLIGEVHGLQRALAYRGPETVLDLLQRSGGITPGAEPEHVYLIRSRIADGRPPEVFHIDLQAILLKNDQRSNIRLQPFDQVYVGEARQSIVDRCIPPFARPLYQAVTGYRRREPEIPK